MKSNVYPLYFCATQWVENKCVADRMVEVWSNIKKIMEFWKSLPKYKQHVKATLKSVMLLLICLLRLRQSSLVLYAPLLNNT